MAAVPHEPPPVVAVPAIDVATAQPGDKYARFEERAKRRRVDRRIEVARAAIEAGRVREAAAALGEVTELDPNLPELASLTAAFEQMRRTTVRRTHRGPWLAAAAAFGAMILGASIIEESHMLLSRPTTAVAPLVHMDAPLPLDVPAAAAAEPSSASVGTSGLDADQIEPRRTAEPELRVADARPTPAPSPRVDIAQGPIAASTSQLARTPLPAPPTSAPLPPPPASVPVQETARIAGPSRPVEPPVSSTAQATRPNASSSGPPAGSQAAQGNGFTPSGSNAYTPNVLPAVNMDEVLVKQALQRYRTAYEGLDAQSAQAVWPAVNQAALARAFDGLESQRLTFDECNVAVMGEHASATCRGTARYVPKVGSREPRVEPRVWSFALRKIGQDWKIDTARAER